MRPPGGSDRVFFHPARLDALGADNEPFRALRGGDPYPLQIGKPDLARFVHRMRDVMSDLRALAAYFTFSRHCLFSLAFYGYRIFGAEAGI